LSGTRTLIGFADSSCRGVVKLNEPTCVALDTSDPVAGPQLMIGEDTGGRVQCLSLRTSVMTTVAGVSSAEGSFSFDGPASSARFTSICDIVVAPNGVLFVEDAIGGVRRISAATRPASGGGAAAERMVTTPIGKAGRWAREREFPAHGLALHVPAAAAAAHTSSMALPVASDPEREDGDAADGDVRDGADPLRRRMTVSPGDVGRLYACSRDGVHAFDLATGEGQLLLDDGWPTSITLTEDGTALFVLHRGAAISRVDTRTGHSVQILTESDDLPLSSLLCCVPDPLTRSLVLSNGNTRQIVRLCGVDL
jgi:hypothetical protein